MPEVSGQDALLEPFLVEDADPFELRVPIDDLAVFFGLSKFEVTLRMLHSFPMKDAGLS
jgi:hypothetical protein